MGKHVNEMLDNLVKMILSDDLPITMKNSVSLLHADIPCRNWSFGNRMYLASANTKDGRGFRQWQKTGRYVKKGCTAFYIMVPYFRKNKKKDDELYISSFGDAPVFRYEDTEGEELAYIKEIEAVNEKLLNLPLIDVAKGLGIKTFADLSNRGEGGSFLPGKIKMCSSEENTFFHELSHAIDHHLGNIGENYALDEVVAELSSCLIASTFGKAANLSDTKHYIQSWTGKEHLGLKILKALDRVNQIYEYIVDHVPVSKTA